MLKECRPKGSFQAKGPDGRTRTLYVFVEILDAATSGHPDAEVEGLLSILTAEGAHVNRLDRGRYQVLGDGIAPDEILTSDAPNAP